MKVDRIAISLEPELLKKLEASMGRRAYWNRSKAIADILRDWLSKEELTKGKGIRAGTVSVVYDHHTSKVLERITDIQHDSGASVISTMHIHLTREECLEVIAVKGNARQIQKIVNHLASVRGVKSCKLSIMK